MDELGGLDFIEAESEATREFLVENLSHGNFYQ